MSDDRSRRHPARSTLTGQVTRHLGVTFGVSALLATVLTAWKPASLDVGELVQQLISDAQVQSGETINEIPPLDEPELMVGIVAGHSGPNPETGYVDPGAVCPDGLTELEINQQIADLVVEGLRAAGLNAEIFEEFDSRLVGFRGLALVSIHADSCAPINELATGYKIAAALDTSVPDRSQRLVTCLADRYGRVTGLRFNANSVTRDMTEYHTFYEIHSLTPAAIIEVGFMYLDREFLTEHPDSAARGIVEGVLCYVNNEPATLDQENRP